MKNKLIAKNTVYQILARLSSAFIGFLITVLIARQFGVDGFGDFTKVTSFVAIFYLIEDFGLNALFLQNEKYEYKNLFYLRTFVSAILFVLLNALAYLLPYNQLLGTGFSDSSRFYIFIFSFSILFQGIIFSASSVFQKKRNYFSYMLGIALGAIINLVLVFTFVFLNFSILYIFISSVLAMLFTSLILQLRTKEKILPFSFDVEQAKEIFIKSMPLGLMLIFNLVYFRADMILLSVFATTKDVGIYGLSYRFFDFLIALPLFLSNAIYPFLIETSKNKKEFFSLCRKYFYIFLVFSFIVLIPFWFISPLFTLIKQDFSQSIMPFRILLISLPFFFTTSFLQWVLITLGEQKYLMFIYFISTIFNIALNIVYIPKYSYFASASITLFSEGLILLFLIIKILHIRILLERKKKNNE